MIKIEDEAITFVVQGPVQASANRQQIAGITEQCLNSIRRYFPQSTIILSTWKGQPLEGLSYDQVLELDDPGTNTVFHDGKPLKLNNNRQMYSSHMGLKAVKTQYAVKLRTDNVLTGRQFIDLYKQYADLPRAKNFQFLTQRVLTSNTFFISSHYGHPVHFHKSDLFDFGLTQDLLKIWSDRWIPELHFSLRAGYKERHPATEQILCLNWISSLLGKELHIKNKTCDDAGLGEDFWPQFIANNLLIDNPEKIGLDVTDRFYKRGNLALEYDLKDWLFLNGVISKNQLFDTKRIYRTYKKLTGLMLKKVHPIRTKA